MIEVARDKMVETSCRACTITMGAGKDGKLAQDNVTLDTRGQKRTRLRYIRSRMRRLKYMQSPCTYKSSIVSNEAIYDSE